MRGQTGRTPVFVVKGLPRRKTGERPVCPHISPIFPTTHPTGARYGTIFRCRISLAYILHSGHLCRLQLRSRTRFSQLFISQTGLNLSAPTSTATRTSAGSLRRMRCGPLPKSGRRPNRGIVGGQHLLPLPTANQPIRGRCSMKSILGRVKPTGAVGAVVLALGLVSTVWGAPKYKVLHS